ncbi:RecB family exonuclease [Salsipaludibacter albus]|uniref:RecB family exonuclease n=1 Tax=Salsipaludibacter albus TaxID=2849650 RepID=UPI001EE49CBD|nr:PD-(D/E)XK nuclease family protein [Salsipaludibacter albus]MBY5161642.1 PD-(D/E)XK nuclease family protein [Salsipaludibacter albus]
METTTVTTDGAVLRLDGTEDDEGVDGGELEPTRPPLIATDGRVRLSFSRIDTFQQCSLRFRYRYVDHLPGKSATYLSFGTSIHAALELFHERTLFGMPSQDELLEFLYDHWDSSGYAEVSRDRQVDDYRRAQHTLQRYHQRVADDYRPAADTEKWFELPVGDEALVVGSIDRVDVDDDGDLHVVDYKTGKLRDREKVRGSLQLAIYALACEHLYGRLPATVALDYVVAGVEVRVAVDELDLDGAREAIVDTARRVLDEQYEPVPTRLCDWCDHQSVCPAWEGDGEGYGAAVVERDRLRRELRRGLGRLRSLEAGIDRLADELAERGLDPVGSDDTATTLRGRPAEDVVADDHDDQPDDQPEDQPRGTSTAG